MKKRRPVQPENFERIRTPKGDEMYAVVEQRLGYNKMYVRCQDGRVRIARIPGRFSRRLWVREGDVVIIIPWVVQGEKKCDIIYRYRAAQKEFLERNNKIPEELL
ncbi:MAG: translation initiation factor eIF-1A [Candidatus Altiarchaeota archaeon]|nr:translation initiation factor eIF-1A [Candidatus Altiarchaeota archaeon]